MTIEELIEMLPEQFRQYAEEYILIVSEMAEEEIVALADSLIEGNWQSAYEMIVQKETTQELLERLDGINTELGQLNSENAENIRKQQEILKALVTVGLMVLKEKI